MGRLRRRTPAAHTDEHEPTLSQFVMPSTRPSTTTVHRQGKVTARIARLMGRRTCDVFLLSGSHLCGAVVAVSCGYDFGQYTPRAHILFIALSVPSIDYATTKV